MTDHLAKAERIVVKVGSALLVDSKAGALKRDWLASLAADIAAKLPPGVALPPGGVNPRALDQLPEATRAIVLPAFTAALHPVFLTAAAIGVIGFGLTWLLKETPLRRRGPAPAAAPGE